MAHVFTPKVLEREQPHIEHDVNVLLDKLIVSTPPLDLRTTFSEPLCTAVMCRLLRVPFEDAGKFRAWTEAGAHSDNMGRSISGIQRMMSYVSSLVADRRRNPGEDLVSRLLASVESGDRRPQFGRVEKLVAGMLAFGRETPASSIDHGVLLLLSNPDQLELARTGSAKLDGAVEESLRLFKPPAATPHGLLRYAHGMVEIAGETIQTGDMVLVDIAAANYDDRVFAAPHEFDITRQPNPHLTFGQGFYMCNFAKLARIELRASLGALIQRIPGLRLSVPSESLRHKDHLRTAGLVELPVTW